MCPGDVGGDICHPQNIMYTQKLAHRHKTRKYVQAEGSLREVLEFLVCLQNLVANLVLPVFNVQTGEGRGEYYSVFHDFLAI